MRHTLSNVSKIAAEDTRRTRRLLSHINIDTPCFSLHEHNERQKIEWLVQLLESGESIALVCDAGTPLISDPGYPLISHLREKNHKVVPIPGPCALIAALSVSGLPTDRFVFEGFLPSKSSARINQLETNQHEKGTTIYYESSHRIKACVDDIGTVFGKDRKMVIAREMTKTFETVKSGTAQEIADFIGRDPDQSKGEFVILVKGANKKKAMLSEDSKQLASLLVEHLPGKKAAKITSDMFGDKKNEIYRYLLSKV